MPKSNDKRCEVCGQQRANRDGWWGELGVVRLCAACMDRALAYTTVIDSLAKRLLQMMTMAQETKKHKQTPAKQA